MANELLDLITQCDLLDGGKATVRNYICQTNTQISRTHFFGGFCFGDCFDVHICVAANFHAKFNVWLLCSFCPVTKHSFSCHIAQMQEMGLSATR